VPLQCLSRNSVTLISTLLLTVLTYLLTYLLCAFNHRDVVCAGEMSSIEFQEGEPVALNVDESGPEDWLTTTASESSQGTADAYVPKYPGLQDFSRRYADIHGYIAAVVCIWGVLANLVNIVVLTRRKMITPTNVLLTWLAVADLLTMATFLPFCLHFYVLRDRRLEFPSTRSAGWIRLSFITCRPIGAKQSKGNMDLYSASSRTRL